MGNLIRVARKYGVRSTTVRAECVRQGIALKPRGHVKGQKKSQAWREASAKHWSDPVWREAQRKNWLERLSTMNGPSANSPLEALLYRSLAKAGISFSTQRVLLGRYCVDILIAQKPVVIEADGNTHLRKKAEDTARDATLRAAGYEVFRFTGKPICNDPDGCIAQVIEATGLVPDEDPVSDIRNGMVGSDNPRWKGGKTEWVCAVCGVRFLAWSSGYGKPRVTCSKECLTQWQKETLVSVRNRRPWGSLGHGTADGDIVRSHVQWQSVRGQQKCLAPASQQERVAE
ncbi:MAG: DUF559 domain-containing protein [Pseudomonadota bacterium]